MNKIISLVGSQHKPMAIRWLWAYVAARRSERNLEATARFETHPGRPVAVEGIGSHGSKLGVRRKLIGLLVDTSRTELISGFSRDIFSDPDQSGGIRSKVWATHRARTWPDVARISDALERSGKTRYSELMVNNPVFLGVIYPSGDDRSRRSAAHLGALMSLPVHEYPTGNCGCVATPKKRKGKNAQSKKWGNFKGQRGPLWVHGQRELIHALAPLANALTASASANFKEISGEFWALQVCSGLMPEIFWRGADSLPARYRLARAEHSRRLARAKMEISEKLSEIGGAP